MPSLLVLVLMMTIIMKLLGRYLIKPLLVKLPLREEHSLMTEMFMFSMNVYLLETMISSSTIHAEMDYIMTMLSFALVLTVLSNLNSMRLILETLILNLLQLHPSMTHSCI